MKVITFSRHFPAKHPRKGEPTYFVEKIWQGLNSFPLMVEEIINPDPRLEEHLKNHFTKVYDPKWHTIRSGNRWKVGDWFQPRVWSAQPYKSKQVDISLPLQMKKIWTFRAMFEPYHKAIFYLDDKEISVESIEEIAMNDGLSKIDFLDWFGIHPKNKSFQFSGQVLCWNESINYDLPCFNE